MRLFITFEGGEGCGKSTQTKILHKKLNESQIPSILLREPGGTPLGEKVRNLLKRSTSIHISALTEMILFNASRSQLVSEIILPELQQGKIVICDRFTDSTIAYQYYGRGLNRASVLEMNRLASQSLKPDLTFLLDIDPQIGLSRKPGAANDRFEQEQLAFHQRVRQGFLAMAGEEPKRWVVIDSTLSRPAISNLIWEKISALLRGE
jgi:dTMP kinase